MIKGNLKCIVYFFFFQSSSGITLIMYLSLSMILGKTRLMQLSLVLKVFPICIICKTSGVISRCNFDKHLDIANIILH